MGCRKQLAGEATSARKRARFRARAERASGRSCECLRVELRDERTTATSQELRAQSGEMFFRKRKRKWASHSFGRAGSSWQVKLLRHLRAKEFALGMMIVALVLLGASCAQSDKLQDSSTGTRTTGQTKTTSGNNEAQGEPELELAPTRSKRADSADSTRVLAVGGQFVELSCPLASELSALTQHTLVWRKDGTRLEQLSPRQRIHANGSLTIAAAQPKLDEASYECAIVSQQQQQHQEQRSGERALKSHRFHLRLLLAPRVAPFEFPADAQVGMRLMLTCSVLEGQQPVSFVWLKDGQLIAGDNRGSRANSLGQLHQQQLAERLAAANAHELLAGHSDLGEPARLDYRLVGVPATGRAEPEELLAALSDAAVRVRQADDYSMLTIERLELKHSGKYTCSVQNEAARASHSAQLVINAPPTLTTEPRDTDLVSGQSGRLDCAASGQPRPTISWFRAREMANRQWDYVPLYESGRLSALANGSLLLANVTQREQGHYLCAAKNGFGPELTKLIRLTVHEPARFMAKYATLEVRAEERASLECSATGEGPIALHWLDRQANAISSTDKRFILEAPQESANTTSARLILTRSTRADSGHYTCEASNKYGTDRLVTNLLVLDAPDKPIELAATNSTANTISLRWQLPFAGNAPISAYLVQYQSDDPLDDLLAARANSQQQPASLKAALEALSGAPSGESADEAIDRALVELTVEQSSTHLVVKELSPYCVYRLRLAAINKIGLGEFSDWIRAKTEEAPPSGVPLKIQAAATGPNSIKLTWSPPERRAWNGQLNGFNIGYRPLDSPFELNKTLDWSPPTLQSLLVDADKHGAVSREPPEVNQQANRTDSSRLLLRHQLRQLLALQQQELVAHLTNLQRSTTYLVWVQALNGRGFGPQSHALSVKTLDDVPPSAPLIKVQSASPNSITIAWSMLSNFVSPANLYSLFYRRLPQLRPSNASSGSSDGATGQASEAGVFIERSITSQQLLLGTSVFLAGQEQEVPEIRLHQQTAHFQQYVYTLDQLDCGNVYEFYMTTRNSVGKSEPSSTVSARTLGEPPLAPSNRNSLFAKIGVNEVALNLAAWSTGGCPLTHVSLRYKQAPVPSGSNFASANTSALSVSWPVSATVPSALLAAVNSQLTEVRGHQSQTVHKSSASEPIARLQPEFSIRNLAASTCYELEIAAYNSAGHTVAQYEFVTANVNGSRAGYSRREGSLRFDQRGASLDQPADLSHYVEQQASFANQVGQGGHLISILLMTLCFVCLFVSSTFCYFRLTDSWKQTRRPSTDTNATSSKGLPCPALGTSPSSSAKSSMWRLQNHLNGHLKQQKNSDHDSPGAVHYCVRDPASSAGQMTNKGQLPFSQSVSMKDFNLFTAPTDLGAATLGHKNYRASVRPIGEPKSGTMRNRLHSGAYGFNRVPVVLSNYATNNVGHTQVCYGTSCKQQEQEDSYANQADSSMNSNNKHLNGGNYDSYQCNYSNDGQQQETSWTHYADQQLTNRDKPTYAVPTTNYGDQVNPYGNQRAEYDSNNNNNNCGQTSIDACIQHLMDQQYQQQQQHQQYAMIVGQKTETNRGSNTFGNADNLYPPNGADPSNLQAKFQSLSTTCGHSVVDSSSASSGIDVGAHMDCGSSATGTSQSNASNNGYLLAHPACDQNLSKETFVQALNL